MRLRNKDIAKQLGISAAAVSLAINNKPGVSEETRRKVWEIVNDNANMEYQSIDADRKKVAGSILFSVHKKHGKIMNDKPFFSDIVETVQQEAMHQSYSLILSHYMPEQDLEQYIKYIESLSIDGMIVFATEMDKEDLEFYKKLKVPMVLLDSSFDLCNIDAVTLDNQVAIVKAVHYAYEMGHRNIGYLKSDTYINNFGHRFDGFLKGLRECGLSYNDDWVFALPCTMEGAYSKMDGILKQRGKESSLPTIFLSDLDYIAVGAIRAFQHNGYMIPEDISFIGFDDVAVSTVVNPLLTTIRVNRMDIGRIAVQCLIEKIRKEGKYCVATQVSSEFICRESVKKLSVK